MSLFKPNLKKMKEKKDIPGLIKALSNIWYPDVRQGAAEALGQIGDVSAIVPLITAQKDAIIAVREAAIAALNQIHDRAITVKDVSILIEIVNQNFSGIKNPRIEESLNLVAEESGMELLIGALRHTNDVVRAVTAQILGKNRYTKAVPSLIYALKDNKVEVCVCAAESLGKIGDLRAVEPLIKVLGRINWRMGPNDYVAIAVVKALGDLRDVRAVKQLLVEVCPKYFEIPDLDGGEVVYSYQYRETIIDTLAKIGEPAKELLTDALKNRNNYIREAAQEALAKIEANRPW